MKLNPFRRLIKKAGNELSAHMEEMVPAIVDTVVDRVNEKYEGVLKIEFPGGIVITGRVQDQEPEEEEAEPEMKKSWE